jgi:hypothetical protein
VLRAIDRLAIVLRDVPLAWALGNCFAFRIRQADYRQMRRELAELADEMKDMRDEFHQYQAIEEAIGIERDPDMLLN